MSKCLYCKKYIIGVKHFCSDKCKESMRKLEEETNYYEDRYDKMNYYENDISR